ncbi:MAG: glycosyltransferase family 39 protein [Butyrivibrio sp.]|nr:glycosyltransferase family 39 protein [Butyrivibrio sp.]
MSESSRVKNEKRIYDFLPSRPETMAVTLFIIAMGAYYIWRMFAITPHYDELYTYYNFISRGPIYSAIHWPLPNNHVGYSVISAIFNLFGNSYIGLRGVSYIAAVLNLYLVYVISKRYYSHAIPFGAVVLYASMQIVNDYSVQGRGYTLATTCFLCAIYYIGCICRLGADKKSYYYFLGAAFVMGLYIVPSSVYWVIPVGASGVIFLLINAVRSKDVYETFYENIYYKKLRKLLYTGVISAGIVVFLYMIIWLAIGSNLLVKDENSLFFGASHVSTIIKATFKSMWTGIDYMLSMPYIQGMTHENFWNRVFPWFMSLLNYYVPGFSVLLLVIMLVSLGCLVYECVKHFEYSRTVVNLVVIVNIFFFVAMICLEHKLPYLRVFTHGAFVIVLCVCTALERLINLCIRLYNQKKLIDKGINVSKTSKEFETMAKDDRWYAGFATYLPIICIVIFFGFRFFDPGFSYQIASRENDIFNTLYIAEVTKRHNIAVLDCDQQYLLKFGWDIDCQKTDIEGADCVLLDKNMFVPEYTGEDFWKFYQTYETIDWNYLNSMHVLYENDNLVLYIK